MAHGMSPAASGVRNALFVQAAVTLLFGLLRTGAGGVWTLATVAVAVAAVGLGAALKATPAMRTAVLGYEGFAVVFGAAGLVVGHYVPGTIIGLHLLIKLAQTSSAEFTAAPAVGELVGAAAPWAAPAAPAAASGFPPPASQPVAYPSAPAPATYPQPFPPQAPFLPPQPGAHPGGSTVLPIPPPPPPPAPVPSFEVPAPPVQPAVVPVRAAAPAEAAPVPAQETRPAASALEDAVRELAASAAAPAQEPAPEPAPEPVAPPEPELPRSAVACLTILPS